MAKETKLLRKMYLMSDASIQKLKELDEAEKAFSILDKKMKTILYNKKLSAHTKWMLYSNLLQKYDNMRRQISLEYKNKVDSKGNKVETKDETDSPATKEQRFVTPINPFDQNIRDNIPNINDMDFSNEFENRDNSELFGEGELEPLSPNASRRLSAFSVASATKKSAVPLRHHLMQDLSWMANNDRDVADINITIPSVDDDDDDELDPPPKKKVKNSVSLTINGYIYSIHKDDVEDFKEFASEELRRYPKQTKLLDHRFQEWKKRKDREYREMAEAEQILVEKEKKRLKRRQEESETAKLLEQNRFEVEQKRQQKEQMEHWSGAEHISMTNRKSKSPVKTAVKTEKPKTTTTKIRAVSKTQPSVANMFPKSKSADERKARLEARLNNAQKGKGKSIQWYRMK